MPQAAWVAAPSGSVALTCTDKLATRRDTASLTYPPCGRTDNSTFAISVPLRRVNHCQFASLSLANTRPLFLARPAYERCLTRSATNTEPYV